MANGACLRCKNSGYTTRINADTADLLGATRSVPVDYPAREAVDFSPVPLIVEDITLCVQCRTRAGNENGAALSRRVRPR